MQLLVAVLLTAAAFTSGSIVKSSGDNFELLILHNNDMHARFEQTSQLSGACTTADREAGKCYGGFPRVAHVVKEARRAAQTGEGPPVLYLNAGDTYTGTAWFTIYKWKIAAEFINALQPDAVCLGNHEFDDGVDGVIPFIRNLSSPVLAANLVLDKVPELKDEKNLYKSIIITKSDIKIGIIGYLTPETQYLVPKTKVGYVDEVLAINKEVQKLKNLNVNIFIALGHSGIAKDLIIAKEVEDLDLVIGGHSNTFLWNSNITSETPEIPQGPYPMQVKQASGRIVRVVQAYAYTKYMGKLHLIFDSQGEIIACDGLPILLDQQIPRDPELLQIIHNYKKDMDRINNEVVGQSIVFLDGFCRLRECNIGDLITEAMLNFTRENYYQQYNDVNIALTTGGIIRSSIMHIGLPFTLTRGDWINVLPYLNTLCIITMNGATLKQGLEHSVSTWSIVDSTGQFLQISGMEVVYDLARPIGSRVVLAKGACSNCKDTKLEIKEDNVYKVVMPLFVADGGDGYVMFENLTKEILPHSELDSVLYYTNKYSPIKTQIDGRIKILNEDRVDNRADISINKIKFKPSSGNVPKINHKFYHVVVLLCLSNVYFNLF